MKIKINNFKFALSLILSSIIPKIKNILQKNKNKFNSKILEKNSIFVILKI